MPANRMVPVGKSELLKKEWNLRIDQDYKLSLLAQLMHTTRSGVLRQILDDHLDSYIEKEYDAIKDAWHPVPRKR